MPPQQQRPKPKRSTAKKNPAIEKEAGRKPQGPLIISVSIDQQRVSIYDANGLYAESPVSTGMKGHSTPMGVFSVIQKQKYHQSNIYSGAPMPYMQHITWSGRLGETPYGAVCYNNYQNQQPWAGEIYSRWSSDRSGNSLLDHFIHAGKCTIFPDRR